MQCPRCGLFNPPEAARCDRGYNFVDRIEGADLLRRSGANNMVIGGLSFFIGLAITIVGFAIAASLAEAGVGCFYVISRGQSSSEPSNSSGVGGSTPEVRRFSSLLPFRRIRQRARPLVRRNELPPVRENLPARGYRLPE
jgi:hypothetical protein